VDTWYSSWRRSGSRPAAAHYAGHDLQDRLIAEMNEALRLPGLSNAWTMPIKGRIDMLATGIRTPVA